MASTLVAHAGAKVLTLDDLRQLPPPVSRGPLHRPVPYIDLALAFRDALVGAHLDITREQYAAQRDGGRFFAALDLAPRPGASIERLPDGTGLSVAYRSSTDRSFAVKGVAGARVFVCDNLALSGEGVIFHRKNTIGFRLWDVVRRGMDRLLASFTTLNMTINKLGEWELDSGQAESMAYRAAVAQRAVPVRLLQGVHEAYFVKGPSGEYPDCAPRTAWGLHNSFTRAIGEAGESLPVKLAWSEKVGRAFGLGMPS